VIYRQSIVSDSGKPFAEQSQVHAQFETSRRAYRRIRRVALSRPASLPALISRSVKNNFPVIVIGTIQRGKVAALSHRPACGQSRRTDAVFAATMVLFAVYFPAAFYLTHSYKDPPTMRPLWPMSRAASGSCASTVWLPKETNKVAIYKDGVEVGYATKVYDDPDPAELATKRFTLVEFSGCKS
jgi:hypothetical protein